MLATLPVTQQYFMYGRIAVYPCVVEFELWIGKHCSVGLPFLFVGRKNELIGNQLILSTNEKNANISDMKPDGNTVFLWKSCRHTHLKSYRLNYVAEYVFIWPTILNIFTSWNIAAIYYRKNWLLKMVWGILMCVIKYIFIVSQSFNSISGW